MNKPTLIHFQPHSSPQNANKALKVAIKCQNQAEHCIALWFRDIIDRKLYKNLGYSSIYMYGEKELGLSPSRTGDYKRLAEKLETLPKLQKELENGKIGYTKAREIIKVAHAANESQWLDEARKSTRDELVMKVKRARQRARIQLRDNPDQQPLIVMPPDEIPEAAMTHSITFELTTIQLARYERLWEKLFKLGGVPSGSRKAEVLLEALSDLVGNHEKKTGNIFPSVSPVQVHVNHCPECKKTTTTTGRGIISLTRKELEHLSCDARIAVAGKPNKATVPPSTRREVFRRANHQCQTPGCNNNRFLEVHHIKPRRSGGSNSLENLQCLCSGCHALVHQGQWSKEKHPRGVTSTRPDGHSAIRQDKPPRPFQPEGYEALE